MPHLPTGIIESAAIISALLAGRLNLLCSTGGRDSLASSSIYLLTTPAGGAALLLGVLAMPGLMQVADLRAGLSAAALSLPANLILNACNVLQQRRATRSHTGDRQR
jgi:hypothetical protein